jgi:hypothetical protein
MPVSATPTDHHPELNTFCTERAFRAQLNQAISSDSDTGPVPWRTDKWDRGN